MLEIKQLTRLQIIRYCEKLEKENEKMKELCDVYVPRVLKLEEENKRLNEKIKNMEKAEKDFMYIMKKYILNEWNLKKLETLYDICFEGK